MARDAASESCPAADHRAVGSNAQLLGRTRVTAAELLAVQRQAGNRAAATLVARLTDNIGVQRTIEFGGENYHEDKMSKEEYLALWAKIRAQESLSSERYDGIKQRLSYSYFVLFNELIAKAAGTGVMAPEIADQRFTPGTVDSQNVGLVTAVLDDWEKYATDRHDLLKPVMAEFLAKRDQLEEEGLYSHVSNDQFRTLFKRLNTDLKHLGASKFTCGMIKEHCGDPSNWPLVRVLTRDGKIQAVVKYVDVDARGIDDLANDPRNFIPDVDQTSIVKGIARAAVSLTILLTRHATEGRGASISLIPHNLKTKRVYNALGFEVPEQGLKPPKTGVSGSKAILEWRRDRLERQALDAGEFDAEPGTPTPNLDKLGVVEQRLKTLKSQTGWHQVGTGPMVLKPPAQQRYLETASSVLDVPPELEKYLAEKKK